MGQFQEIHLCKIKQHGNLCCNNEWLTTGEVAKILKTSKGVILKMAYERKIIRYKLGRKNLYSSCEINQLVLSGVENGN